MIRLKYPTEAADAGKYSEADLPQWFEKEGGA